MTYQPKPFEVAGVDLIGERQSDGSIKLGSASRFGPDTRTSVPAFPEEIEVCGATYTLEYVKENDWAGRKALEQSDPNDPRLRICWGIYV